MNLEDISCNYLPRYYLMIDLLPTHIHREKMSKVAKVGL